MKRRACLWGIFGISVIFSCSQFKEVNPQADADLPDAPAAVDAAPPPPPPGDEAPITPQVDARVVPADFVCRVWQDGAAPTDGGVGCSLRRRISLETRILLTNKPSIAVTTTGRIVAAYGDYLFDSVSQLDVTHFTAATPVLGGRKTERIGSDLEGMAGWRTAVVSGDGDEAHVFSHDLGGNVRAGPLLYRRLIGGTIAPEQTVTTNVPRASPFAAAAARQGELLVTYLRPNGTDAASGGVVVSHHRGAPTAAFGPAVVASSTVVQETTPWAGASSLSVDQNRLFFLAYCDAPSPLGQPYGILKSKTLSAAGGGAWEGVRTVHNGIPDGVSGQDPVLVVRGSTKFASYFYAKSNARSAELLVSSWQSDTGPVKTEAATSGLEVPFGKPTTYAQAMAVDSFGLVHIVYFSAFAGIDNIFYLRQAVVEGAPQWIEDIVDSDVNEPGLPGLVAITLDANDRPHILYHSHKRATLYYATRFDR